MTFNKHVFFLFVLFVVLFFSSCPSPPFQPLPPGSNISFNIAGVSLRKTEYLLDGFNPIINLLEFSLGENDSGKKIFDPDTFIIKYPVSYNNNSNNFSIPDLDKKTFYTYRVNRDAAIVNENEEAAGKDSLSFNLYDFAETKFLNKSGNWERNVYHIYPNQSQFHPNNGKELMLKSNTQNSLSLVYDFFGSSSIDVEVTFGVSDTIVTDFHSNEKAFNYGADWVEILNQNNYVFTDLPNPNEMLNIVIMGDGYSSISDISLYEATVREMLNNFQHNNFFSYYEHISKINIFRLNTMSLSNGRNIIGVSNSAPYGDTSRITRIIESSFTGSPITMKNIDVIVIVKRITSNYAQTYGNLFAAKNGQPVNIIVTNGYDFSHLLGHALARLQDETFGKCSFLHTGNDAVFGNWYDKKLRNVSSMDDGIKWEIITKKGYRIATSTWNDDYGLGTMDIPITKQIYGDIRPYYYIPSRESTMGGPTNAAISNFGPVNFYHLRASFLYRTGKLAVQGNKKTDQNYTGSNDYEWPDYSIDDFISGGFGPAFFPLN